MSIAIMNEMVRRGHQVEAISLDPHSACTFYPLDPAVLWTRINIGDPSRRATVREVIAREAEMRAVIRRFRPDVAIGFQQGAFLTIALAALGTGTPVIAAERNAPHRFNHLKDGHGRSFQYATFRLARFITVQFESYRDHYPANLRPRIVTIPNPVPPARGTSDPAGGCKARKTLLCVGRLSYQKNQALLVKAFARIAPHFPDWDLELVGDGEDRPALEDLAASIVPSGRVRFAGAQADVDRHFRAAQLFCLASRWEGFPNALAEAMAFGLPTVGMADCAGVNILIEDGRTGLLAPDGGVEALGKTLAVLMDNPDRRVAMGEAGRASVTHFEPTAVFDSWETLFIRAAQR